RLMDPEIKLFYQGWGWGVNPTSHSPGFWSRGNGWILTAMTLALENLPADHPKRPALSQVYNRFLMSLIDYQDTSGLWHQLIDRQDTFEETSGSALFLYCTARAVRGGWIDRKYADVVKWGTDGLKFVVDPDGIIWGTCVGTGTPNTIEDYYARPAPVNDYHGIGPVMLALIEAARLGIE
ncbi:glycoside hydrolase family 88 protein, partial [candidate division KSB1 bacterium]